MTHDTFQPPEDLLLKISQDLKPVAPSPLPSGLALRLAPIAVAVSSLVLIIIGIRGDALTLGPVVTWGGSIVQFSLALVLVWIAAREGTPARRLPGNRVGLVVVATALAVAVVATWTFVAAPAAAVSVMSSRRSVWLPVLGCGIGGTVAGTLLVLVFAWCFRHSFAARPAVAGALYGLGAGVAVNSGWRLACPISTLGHSLGVHGIAIVSTTLLGAAAAQLIAKRGSGGGMR